MIVRVFRAEATVTNAKAYKDFLQREIFPQLLALPGCTGAELLVEETGSDASVMVQSRWASRAAIKAFAGEEIGRAVVEPEARALLTRFDETVSHYEVTLEIRP
jgi:quinol monooxygenase YgiN